MKSSLIRYGVLLVMLAIYFNGMTQLIPQQDEQCATMDQDRINKLKYNWGSLDQLEPLIQQKIEEIELKRQAGRFEAVVTIPVIFHIVHNGEDIGTGTNLSEERIQAQIEVLNEDFRRLPGTPGSSVSHPDQADIEIEFCLATVDENGNNMLEAGIDRVDGEQSGWTRQEIEGFLKPQTIWNPNLYFNVWSVNFDAPDNTLLGYAQFPSASGLNGLPESGGPSSTDGVVLRYTVVGSIDKGDFTGMQPDHNRGRTLTHETGHWLGLRHTWGDGPCGADDFCADTPESDAPNYGCQIGTISCGSVDMVENYMDYTDDVCMGLFTQDQKARILAVMELSPRRGILVNSTVCGAPNDLPPVANFTADRTTVLLGGSVRFTDLSVNFPDEWSWFFEGGDPEFSNSPNPIVTYNTPGSYDVSLITSNENGDSELLLIEDFIQVSTEGLCNDLSNFGTGTETLLRVPAASDSSGYIAGHNSMMDMAKSEFFLNDLGYMELSGALINFGYAYSEDMDATVKVVVWNARGPQNAPGAIVEEKDVLIRQIKEDIAANRSTEVNFERRVPIFRGTPFHIGVMLEYNGDTVAINTTANGESTKQTSWEQNSDGVWIPYSLAWGIDVAHDITAMVGMNPSVSIAASSQSIFAGQKVTLSASGASIFTWSSDQGELNGALGPQIDVYPRQTTEYTVSGSGFALCREEVSVRIYVKDPPLSAEEQLAGKVHIYPNPATDYALITFEGDIEPGVKIRIYNTLGHSVFTTELNTPVSTMRINTNNWQSGVYIVRIETSIGLIRKRIVLR